MANIFSGLFGGGSNAAALAKYNYDLKRQKETQDYIDRNQDLMGQTQAYDAAIQDMTPERQRQMKLYQMMAGGRMTGDKGMEGMVKSLGQRGGTIANDLSQDKKFDLAKRLWDYKKENPLLGDEAAKIQVARQFQEWAEEDVRKNGAKSKYWGMGKAALAEAAWRAEQMIETETGYQSLLRPEFVLSKNIEEGAFLRAAGPKYAGQYLEFPELVAAADRTIYDLDRKQEDVAKAIGAATDSALGWQGLTLGWAPGTDAKKYQDLKEAIVNNIGLAKLQEMKEQSQTGASGLGPLSEKELRVLEGIMGSMEATSDPRTIQGLLKRLDAFYQDAKETRMRGLQDIHRQNMITEKRMIDRGVDIQPYKINKTYEYLLNPKGSTRTNVGPTQQKLEAPPAQDGGAQESLEERKRKYQ